MKIALLLKEHYREHAVQWQKRLSPKVQTEFVSYSTFEELEACFYELKDRVDGIYVSGIMPYRALQILISEEDQVCLAHSPIDMENTYRILLQKMVESGVHTLSRIGMDFLRGNADLENLIRTEKFSQAVHEYETKWEKMKTVEEINEEEQAICQYYREQCRKNRFDMVITYFHSVAESLREFDVECFYVYPSVQTFLQSIEGLQKNISLMAMKKKMPAVIYIDLDAADRKGSDIRRAMEQFNKKYLNQMMLKENYAGLEYITDYAFLRKITDGFSKCRIGAWLQEQTGFMGAVGYGLGNNLPQARLNAIDASHYGRNIKGNGCASVLIDGEENLIVLKKGSTEQSINVSEGYISEIANQVKLSSETILKVIGVMQTYGTAEITSQELMDALHISLRTANKFLSNLEKNGYAQVAGLKRSGNKGRPVNVYRILMNYEN